MKRVLSLVLVLAMLLSVAMAVSAEPTTAQDKDESPNDNLVPGWTPSDSGTTPGTAGITAGWVLGGDSGDEDTQLKDDRIDSEGIFWLDQEKTREYQGKFAVDGNNNLIPAEAADLADPNGKLPTDATAWIGFSGPGQSESADATIEGLPVGTNGTALLSYRVYFDREKLAYGITVTAIADTTVEIFTGVNVKLTIAKKFKNGTWKATLNVWSGFRVANRRYTSGDVYKDIYGRYVIDATDGRPVVDQSAVEKAYGKQLIVRYPKYTLGVDKITNQLTAFYALAKVDNLNAGTVDTKSEALIAKFSFPGTRIKDPVTLEFRVNPDVLSWKASKYYAYEVDATTGKPIKATEFEATLSTNRKDNLSGTTDAVLEVKIGADEPLSAYGKASAKKSYAIYGTPQEEVPAESEDAGEPAAPSAPPATDNPATGAGEAVNVASVFAIVALAAAGFVALKKSK
ncbi:MAG: hypothetical protein LBC56_01145 [Oscillospiraceae bacterium]|jgi:hypothetical protein|nr:hypothetical protein [Oscillospiraceae bacterium]